MKAVVQRVKRASVEINEGEHASINIGFLVLLGVEVEDDEKDAKVLANKISGLRIFCDNRDKMNLSLNDINGEVLVISNFTLCGDCIKGKRPFFGNAARPEQAKPLYELFCYYLKNNGISKVAKGIFGADMQVSLTNDGPVTIIIDSKELNRK